MKYLVLLVILAVVIGWFFGRGRRKPEPPSAAGSASPSQKKAPERIEMIACAHCGVHLPRSEAAFDAAGRPFCTPEHRVAGPN